MKHQLWQDQEWLRGVTDHLADEFDGVWLHCPLYVASKADGIDSELGILYTEKRKDGRPIRRNALWPFIVRPDNHWDIILKRFSRILAVSASLRDKLTESGLPVLTKDMSKDFIFSVDGFRTTAGKRNRLVREGCNKFRADGGTCRPFQREDRARCLEIFQAWKDWYRERFGEGFHYQITSSRYVKAALQSSVHDFPSVSIIVAEAKGRIIGFNIQWHHRKESVCLARVHDNSIRGLFAALLHYPSVALPDDVEFWNDGCGDGDKGSLTEHKRRLKPLEERTYYTIYSKTVQPIVRDDSMRLF